MSSSTAPVEAAFTFLDLLRQTDLEREELAEGFEDNPFPEPWASLWADTEKALVVANATWVARLIDSDILATIEGYLKKTPLHLQRNAFAGTVTLSTPGILDGLRDRVSAAKSKSEVSTEGQYSTVGPELYHAMLVEGVLDWTVRTAADEGYEVRCCAECGKWFEPQLKARSRFCSPSCRKFFNNLRNSDHSIATFECNGCEETRSMEDFSGLQFWALSDRAITPLRMCRYRQSARKCCLHCVRSSHQEWRRYIAPMESLSERATI